MEKRYYKKKYVLSIRQQDAYVYVSLIRKLFLESLIDFQAF